MKKRVLLTLISLAGLAHLSGAQDRRECVADVNGYKIHTVYVTGNHFNAVVWAYKHLSDESCLTPVLDPSKADAILELYDPNATELGVSQDDSISVDCSSSGSGSHCIDSSGNEMDVNCDASGNCSAYYGPAVAPAVLHALGEWVRSASYQGEAKLYTPDHRLIWKSENQKGHGPHESLWMDKLRLGSMAPTCKMPGAWGWPKYKTFRHWAGTTCGIEFAPAVHIDIKANQRIAAKLGAANAKRDEAAAMKKNAEQAAARQSSQ